MALDGFGNRLKAVRQDRGYTQKQLADLLGVTEQAVSKYERGTSYPDISMLDGISLILDCSLDYLFQYKSGNKNQFNQDSVEKKKEITRYLLPDIISLQFGETLIPFFVEESKKGFPHINEIRQEIAQQWGIVIPAIRVMDQFMLARNEYQICIYGLCVFKGEWKQKEEEGFLSIFRKLKEMIFKNIALVLNNQCIYFMVENLLEKYPYIIKGIIPELISYSRLRQVLLCLLHEYGYTVNPLILIIEIMEQHLEITDSMELAGQIAKELGEGFLLEHWMK